MTIHLELHWFCTHFCHFFSSNAILLKTHYIQQKEFNKLPIGCKPKQDAEKNIFNFSVSFTEAEKSLLVKGLSFSLTPKKLSYSDYLVNCEFFYRSIGNLKILPRNNLNYIKTKLNNLALASFCFCNAKTS